MSAAKAQKEIDKAIKHLIEFINKSPDWSSRFDELMGQINLIASGLHRYDS